jgi:hypothetical protein
MATGLGRGLALGIAEARIDEIQHRFALAQAIAPRPEARQAPTAGKFATS